MFAAMLQQKVKLLPQTIRTLQEGISSYQFTAIHEKLESRLEINFLLVVFIKFYFAQGNIFFILLICTAENPDENHPNSGFTKNYVSLK